MSSTTPLKPRPPPGQQGSTPFRSTSTNRFRSSLVPMSRPSPSRTAHLTGKFAINPSYGRDLFRTSTPQTTRTTKFAPSLPADATKTTPTARKFTQKTTHGGMSSIASTEPFKMRIPSPDPELSGEALSKEVPDDPNRAGTIYADQFLAHKCPPNFDDVQRRQFFCVLDLRRLKYAADEIFAKKDWKLNIMNFAKEYEKSRGLIMLRYGLYEFKNVKPSEEVMKRWRAAHNLPEPEPEAENVVPTTPAAQNVRRGGLTNATSTKRKAEEDLTPKDNALMTSTANQNKRRNVAQEQHNPALTGPAPFKKSKRKADETDEPDENLPNKVQKPTPSAAKSKFESILNRSQSGSTSPLKRTPLASFGTQKPSESQNSTLSNKLNSNAFTASANGFKAAAIDEDSSTQSVLTGHKVGSVPAKSTGNIFSYLSESSANSSGNENGNADEGDTESESEEETSNQEALQSEQPSTSGSAGTNTPQNESSLFSANKPTATPSSLFGDITKSNDLTSKGGLFGRVQMGTNGQPLRATANTEEQGGADSTQEPAVGKDQNKTPAKKPGDYTFNAATTPISFGSSMSNSAKTPNTIQNAESTKESNKPDDSSTAKTPSTLFGVGAPTNPAFQPTTQSLFGASNKPSNSTQTKSNGTASSLFSGQKSTPTPSNLFGSATPKVTFGGVEKTTESDSPAPKKQRSISDAPASQPEAKEASSVPKEPASIFGTPAVNTSAPPTTSLFGNSVKAADTQAKGGNGNLSVFGDTSKASTSGLFGASPTTASPFGADNTKVNGSSVTKSIFDTTSKQPPASSIFGTPKPETTSETNKGSGGFGDQGKNTSSVSATPKSIFGFEGLKPATTTTPSLFSGSSTPSAGIFNAKSSEAAPAENKHATTSASSLFGNNSSSEAIFNSKSADVAPAKKDEPATTKPSSIFSSTPSTSGPIFAFGGQGASTNNTQPLSTPSMIFGGSTNAAQFNDASSKKPDFQFGGSTPSGNSSSFTFGEGSSTPGSSFTFTAGGGGQSFNNPFASLNAIPQTSAAPVFGGKPATPSPSSSFDFKFGQQAPSTPHPAPTNQGGIFGASSGAGNGGPSFSFTQATPNQNSPNPFAPKAPVATFGGGFLQAGGDMPTGPTSPFPAPSSIGTTPVGGTPEPQTPNEDGEEGHQEQISLTNGGPGEEDEIALHEVRAKAIKYVPIGKDSDEEEQKKSPWSTQGVGPLRVLKSKTTGTVRMLLRAEPRGHVALNKALLPDIEYKAKEKTVNFVTASDDGSGLETWVLQVKKPEFARQLVDVLETNKSANK